MSHPQDLSQEALGSWSSTGPWRGRTAPCTRTIPTITNFANPFSQVRISTNTLNTELSDRKKRGLTASMLVADPFIVFAVYYSLFFAGVWLQDIDQVPTVPFLAGFGYLVLLVAFMAWGVYGDEYPWFLAWWTGMRPATGRLFSKRYSFGKFRYRLSAAVRRSTLWVDRDLFVRAYAYKVAPEVSATGDPEGLGDGERTLSAKDRPGLRELIRAFNLRFNQIVGLERGEARSKAIDAEVEVLRETIAEALSEAHTYLDGYLRYLVRIYLDHPQVVREMMYEPTRLRALLARIPQYHPMLKIIVLLVGLLVWIILGLPFPI